jgi:hypothetical protein
MLRIIYENEKELQPISLYAGHIEKYAKLIAFYPLPEKKYKIFCTLTKQTKLGLLNRHLLSVASKLGVSNVYIKHVNRLKIENKKYKNKIEEYKKFSRSTKELEEWKKRNEIEMISALYMLFDMVFEETNKRLNITYRRKKKLEKIDENTSN